MWLLNYNTEQDTPVSMFAAAGTVLTGLLHTDVTVRYKKLGDSSWTTKVLSASNWVEVEDGEYTLTLLAGETDTRGDFILYVTYGATDYFIQIYTVTDWDSEATQLQNVYDLIATKVNKSDILEREKDLDRQLLYLAKDRVELGSLLTQLELQVSALKYRISQLP